MLPSQPNQSLIHGLNVLQALVSADGPIGSRALAKLLEMEHTKVNRMLGTLAALGLAEKTADRKYRPGPGVHVLAAQSIKGSRLLPAALPILKELREEFRPIRLTVALGVLWQRSVCFLYHARPWHAFEEGIARHALWPAEQSSAGVVLLAEVERTPELPVELIQPDPSIARQELRRRLAETRRNGYARLNFPNGQVSIGVTIGKPVIAALAASSDALTDESVPAFVARMKDAALAISERIENPTETEPSPDMAKLLDFEG